MFNGVNNVKGKYIMDKSLLIIIFLLLFGGVITVYAISKYFNIFNSGVIANVNLKIYSDNGTIEINSINWGVIYPNSNNVKTIYIKNIGTLNVTLSFRLANFNPLESQTLTVTNNYDGGVVRPNNIVPVILTLIVPEESSIMFTTFSFNIVIESTEHV